MAPKTPWPPPKPRPSGGRTTLDAAIEAGAQGYAGLKARLAEAAKVQPGQIAQAQAGRRALTTAQYLAVAAYFRDAKGIPWVTGPWLLRDRSRLAGGIVIDHVEDGADRPDVVTTIATHLAAIPADGRTSQAALAAVHAAICDHAPGWQSWAADSPEIVSAATADYARAALGGTLSAAHSAHAAEALVLTLISSVEPDSWATLRALLSDAVDRIETAHRRRYAGTETP